MEVVKNKSVNIGEDVYAILRAHCLENGLKITKYLEIIIKEKLCKKKEKQ